jgi:hypothetical protein
LSETLARATPVAAWLYRLQRPAYRSQAETNEPAAAQIAAQRPSDDNNASIKKASLVRAKAAAGLDLQVRGGSRRTLPSLTEQDEGNTKLRSTGFSLHYKLGYPN